MNCRARAVCSGVLLLLHAAVLSRPARGQDWSFDARDIGLGGLSGTANLATSLLDERRSYRAIVLPFGFLQVFTDAGVYDPGSRKFDPIRAIERVASPLHFVVNRTGSNSAEALFVSDLRNATLSRDLAKYQGFTPTTDLLAEGLIAPGFGRTLRVHRGSANTYQAVYLGAAPYIALHADGVIDPALTAVLSRGTTAANSRLAMTSTEQEQVALAIIGGYRGRFSWLGGSASDHNGLFVAANYKYLWGLAYDAEDIGVALVTDRDGLVDGASNIRVDHRFVNGGAAGSGFAIDLGAELATDRWEFGAGVNGVVNRIDWSDVTRDTYVLSSVTQGGEFTLTTTTIEPGFRAELPVDFRTHVKYYAAEWSAGAGIGHGFGGPSFHGGIERRFDRFEIRGGLRYTFDRWNPAGGAGLDISPRLSVDVAAFGTNTNIERKRQLAIAASLRINYSVERRVRQLHGVR
jgi:hypothetical protein